MLSLSFSAFSGIVMLLIPVHRANTLSPMLVRLSGRIISERFGQSENAELPILVTPSGMLTVSMLVQLLNVPALISVRFFGSTISVRLSQKENAFIPISVTLSGISMLLRSLQYEKASSHILITLSGTEIFSIAVNLNAASPISFTGSPFISDGMVTLTARLSQSDMEA